MTKTAEEKISDVDCFLDEQLWLIGKLFEEEKKNKNEGASHLPTEILRESLKMKYWMIQDLKAVLRGEF